MARKPAHGPRHIVYRADGTIEVHLVDEDGNGLKKVVDDFTAAYIEKRGHCTFTVLGNGLLALGFPGCSTKPVKCDCVAL